MIWFIWIGGIVKVFVIEVNGDGVMNELYSCFEVIVDVRVCKIFDGVGML